MTRVISDISVSLDGYVAGPNPTLDDPLGAGGMQLHEWVFVLESWRRSHGHEGGETGRDSDIVQERVDATGAVVMGRRMFSGGDGPWESDPNAAGWWGDDPPFGCPVFVVTHHAREPLHLGSTTFTFVTDGVESAIEQARSAAGGRDVHIAGGASVVQQAMAAGLLEELEMHVAPVLLGGGTRLLDGLGNAAITLRPTRVVDSPRVTHLRYAVEPLG